MNMLEKYKKVEEEFFEEMKMHEDVIGLMHLGGIARGFADEYSDIDVAVFSDYPLQWLKKGEMITKEGFDLEVFNISLSEGSDGWGPIMKEAYQEGSIAYDPTGKVEAFIKKALVYRTNYRVYEICRLVFAMAWHGWIYSPYKNKKIKGYNWILPSTIWFDRGCEKNAYYVTQYSVNCLLELLFAINERWLPDWKWRYIKSLKLGWLPSNYPQKIDLLLYEKWDQATWAKKLVAFQEILDECIAKVKDELPDDWYQVIEKQ